MANLSAALGKNPNGAGGGKRLGRAARASLGHEPSIAAPRFKSPDDLRQLRQERRTFEALWAPDTNELVTAKADAKCDIRLDRRTMVCIA